MLKIFTDQRGKVNFVDSRNTFVGYDTSVHCCETADWFISDEIVASEPYMDEEGVEQPDVLEGDYYFDRGSPQRYEWPDGGGVVIFRLYSDLANEEDTFLHLWNCHNGYYAHGFELVDGETVLHYGDI